MPVNDIAIDVCVLIYELLRKKFTKDLVLKG